MHARHSAATAVEIAGVTKSFRTVTAVELLSLTIPRGSVYGFIGPNGSGKTTTMRMIANILYSDSGSIRVFGEERSGVRAADIGYLPEERGVYRKMSVKALLRFHAELHGGRRMRTKVGAWLERLGLERWADSKVESLSKGMSQKVQFIAAVVHEPKLVILDEPFSGLDPVSADSIRSAILDMRNAGCTVILSTHDMGVAEKFCDSIFMIFRGRKVLDGTLGNIQSEYGSDTIRVELEDGGDGSTAAGLPGIAQVKNLGRVLELRMNRGCDPQKVLHALASRTRLRAFSVVQPSLHDIFVRIADPQLKAPQAGDGFHA
ncbi:MAG: ATP-binding cassette domain-containing protein [Bryobacterales bacterium]|nr:ATP-binding cassette domain-containing protein [Bryobacterales bacterium]